MPDAPAVEIGRASVRLQRQAVRIARERAFEIAFGAAGEDEISLRVIVQADDPSARIETEIDHPHDAGREPQENHARLACAVRHCEQAVVGTVEIALAAAGPGL